MMNKSAPDKVAEICIMWQSDSPFFAEFLLRFLYVEDEHIPTCGINIKDNRLRLSYNKDFFEKLPKKELEGVLVHEIMHVLNNFRDRVEGRDFKIFNIAQDACINNTILETTINSRQLALPEEGVTMKEIYEMGYEGDVVSELVYNFLFEKADKISISIINTGAEDQQPCKDCDGTGKNENGEDCKSCGGTGKERNKTGRRTLSTIDVHDDQKKFNEVDRQVIEELIKNAKTRSYGSISGSLKSSIESLIATKKIPWRKKLNMYLSKYIFDPGNLYENTWSKRNRRSLPLPGIKKMSKKIVVAIDTSGSVSDDDLKKFFGQIEKIIKDYSSITIIEWDTQINKTYKYKKSDWKRIEPTGRGGTCIQPVFTYVHEKLKGTNLLVNFTDGYFDWDIESYGINTIWAFVNNKSEGVFGKTVHIIEE